MPVHIQRRELEYGLSSRPGRREHAIFRVDFDDPRIDWRQADGETEIAPGVRRCLTAGHTPGHQSFVVDGLGGGGGFVFAFDAADLPRTSSEESAVGGRSACHAGGERRADPPAQADRGRAGYRLVPGHDPEAWPALTAELAQS